MKNLNIVSTATLMMALLHTPLASATEASGMIQEVRVCGSSATSFPGWIRYLAFKVEGKWFGTYSDHYGSGTDYDNNIHTSVVLMAFSAKKIVKVASNGIWVSGMVKCGLPAGNMLHRAAGEFISVVN